MRIAAAQGRSIVTPMLIAVPLGCIAVALTALGVSEPAFAVAAAIGLLYLGLAWFYPHVALIIIFIAAPFQQDVGGGFFAKMGTSEVALAAAFPVFLLQNLLRKRPLLPGPMAVPVALYFGICAFSSWATWRGDTAILSLVQMFLYLVVAVVVFASFARREQDLVLVEWAGVAMGVAFATAAFATSFHMMGLHKNGIGASLSMFTVITLEMWLSSKRPLLRHMTLLSLVIVSAALLFSLSRGAWLGALGGTATVFLLRRQYTVLARTLVVLVPVMVIGWWFMPQESREYATGFEISRENIAARYQSFDFAMDNWKESPIYGVGVGLRKEYDATNVVMLTLAETGVMGLLALLAMHIAFVAMVWRTQSVISRDDALYSLLAIGAALVTAKLLHGMVDHYWSRGPIMMAWASAGMATAVCYRVLEQRKEGWVR